MASDSFETVNADIDITSGKAQRCFRVLGNAKFLGWEVAGETDSFGVANQSDGIEMIFDMKGENIDPHHRIQGEGFIRVNPELYVAAIDYCKIGAPSAVDRMKKTAAEAGALLKLPIGGGQIIRPHGAHDNGDYSLAKQSDFNVPISKRGGAPSRRSPK